ncbi:DUF4254 domain-containing protein [Nocardia brasiliensis]|uniref:DUF4254 domain-containing protein n=1 Tax=Nocardia brasiliensis TaxID=37326 RepID=UPI00366E6C48
MPTEFAAVRIGTEELPSPMELLRAFRDDPDRHKHIVLRAARELVECHERRHKTVEAAHAPDALSGRVAACSKLVEDIDRDRAELIGRIDAWVADNIEHRGGASLHTETLGAVIDRLAAKWVAAQRALRKTPRRQAHTVQVDGEAHLQWCRLAELTDGYRDLITDVAEHRRRLPVW